MDGILNGLLEICLMGSIMILVVMVIHKFFSKKLNAGLMLALWSLVLIRLCLPFTIESPVRVDALLPSPPMIQEVQNQTMFALPSNNTAPPTLNPLPITNNIKTESANIQVQPSQADERFKLSLTNVSFGLWLMGMLATLLLFIKQATSFRKQIKACKMVTDANVLSAVRRISGELRVSKNITVVSCDFVQVPAVFGYFKPYILMPTKFITNMDRENLNAILLHELYHIKCHDILINYIWLLAKAVHWFNPLVWLAYRAYSDDVELCRDAKVTNKLQADGVYLYSQSLIEAARFSRRTTKVPSLTASLFENKSKIRERVLRLVTPQKRSKFATFVCVVIAMVMLIVCFTTACQPTPDKPIVVNKNEGKLEEAFGTEESVQSGERLDTYAPANYSVSQHWKEEIIKNNGYKIIADVDVMMPDVSAYPVQQLRIDPITQEQADRLIDYFVEGEAKFYQLPMPITKPDYERQLIDLRRSLAQVEAGGDGETPESIRAFIKEVEKKWKNAPENNTLNETNTKFTYARNLETGKADSNSSEHFIDVAARDKSELNKTFYINSSEANSSFYYSDSSIELRSDILRQIEWQKDELENTKYMIEPYKSQRETEVSKEIEKWTKRLTLHEQNTVDLEKMQVRAIQILKELGITGMQVEICDKALYIPEIPPQLKSMYDYPEPNLPGVYVQFTRENGGLPCIAQTSGSFSAEMSFENMYCAPFSPENLSMCFDEKGNIRQFSWYNISAIDKTVASDSKILSFDEAKQRIVDTLYYMSGSRFMQDGSEQVSIEYYVKDVRLVMSYINVKDDLEKVMIVPAWLCRVEGRLTDIDEDAPTFGRSFKIGGTEDILINALDGSPNIMPGIVQNIATDRN